MELILVLVIVSAIAIYAQWSRTHRRETRISAPSPSPRENDVEIARKKAHQLANEICSERDKAYAAQPDTQQRKEAIENARSLIEQLRDLSGRHPELSLHGEQNMIRELDAIEAGARQIKPELATFPTEGNIIIAFLDTETTGLGELDEPISIGIVLAEVVLPKGHLVRQVEALYNVREPGVPINPQAQAVHGLSTDFLSGKSFDLSRIRDLIEQADVLIAHNANFDRRMLAKIIPEVLEWPWRCSYRQANWPTSLKNKKLDTICAHFSVERQQPHNALSDARALMDCLLMTTGKTQRSRSFLAGCLSKPNF